MKKSASIIAIAFFFLFPLKAYAGSGGMTLSGNGNVGNGSTFSIDITANVTSGSVVSIGGVFANSNSDCISLVSLTPIDGSADVSGNKFNYISTRGKNSSFVVARATFNAANTTCSSTISLNSLTMSFDDGAELTPNNISKTIKVTKLSDNNNLESIDVSNGSLSPEFSSNNTNYTVSVDSDITSININAKAQDSTATITGTGSKKINFGSNKISIIVKAQNGDTKTYNININREDNRSADTGLKSLSVSYGNLNPAFNTKTTEYDLEVPYEITKLNINAVANDSKSKISIFSPELEAEATTDVTIKVIAENGTSKTYTIHVKRSKDPNKTLSTDNNLLSLLPSIGILSPVFDPNKTNYFIYLPYEIEEITFEYEISDKKYGIAKLDGPEKLQANSANKFTISVTAEDESTKEYTITVYRAKNPEELNGTSTLLKNLTLKNGKLTTKFDSNKFNYTYKKGKNFSYEYELEDENSTVKVIEQEDNIYFIVEAPNGDIGVYCLHKKEMSILTIVLIIILAFLTGVIIILLYLLIKRKGLKKQK